MVLVLIAALVLIHGLLTWTAWQTRKELKGHEMLLAVLVKLQQQRNDNLGAWKSRAGREMLRARLQERLAKEVSHGSAPTDAHPAAPEA